MMGALDVRAGSVLRLEGELWAVLERHHHKPGKGGAIVRLKVRRLASGAVVEKTYRASEKFDDVRLDRVKMQFLYEAGGEFHFMNTASYEQVVFDSGFLGEGRQYLKENMEIDVLLHDGKPVVCEVPMFVALRIVQTDPGLRGDTASGGTKPATLESGAVVQVPLFIQEGETIKVDTRDGSYVERV
ncbi:MAG: elongation factor P [Candidatus Latescibacterota bacterium]|nr:MAG: elongation factor P [Candidatus Latescibacterota bacterium]